MEINTNNSRIGVQMGASTDGNEKSSLKLEVSLGKNAAETQLEEIKQLTGGEGTSNVSVVIAFNATNGKQQELVSLIKNVFDGSLGDQNPLLGMVASAEGELYNFKIIENSDNKVILQVQAAGMAEEFILDQLKSNVGVGVEELAASNQATLSLNAFAGADFYEVKEAQKAGSWSIDTLSKSFKFEVLTQATQGSHLDKKLLSLLKGIHPYFSSSSLGFLQFLKAIDIDVNLRSLEELPEPLKEKLFDNNPMIKNFPQPIPGFEFIDKFVHVIEPEVTVYVTVQKVAAVRLNITLPGFGTAMTATN